jgi:hypothetical protein
VCIAALALVVEQVFRKDEVPGSSPGGGSLYREATMHLEFLRIIGYDICL